MRVASQDPLPAGTAVAGPAGSYELVSPSAHWVRTEWKEEPGIDWALARNTGDAWLNVSILPGRMPTPEIGLARAREELDAMMSTSFRAEHEVPVPAPEGELPGRVGTYCGSFDRELRSRESCVVMLTTVRAGVGYLLVGQARVGGETDLRSELEELVLSLRLLEPERDAEGSDDG